MTIEPVATRRVWRVWTNRSALETGGSAGGVYGGWREDATLFGTVYEDAVDDVLAPQNEPVVVAPTPMDASVDGSETRSARQLLAIPGVAVDGGDEFLGWLDVKRLGESVLNAVSALRAYVTQASIRVARAGEQNEFGRHVIIYVRSGGDQDQFIDELDRFDDEWWCEQPASVKAPLGVYLG